MNMLSVGRKAVLIFCAGVAFNAIAGEPTVGEQFKKGAKTFGAGMRDAAVDVGKTIGSGTKKTAKEIGNAISRDAKTGGDGAAKRRNDRSKTAKLGRQ